jgi:hypothetical protein
MNFTILLSGPSLRSLKALPVSDGTIAVKRAAMLFPADWLVILDIPDLQAPWVDSVQGEPHLLTRRDYRPKYTRRAGTDCETLEKFLPHMPTAWGCFSSCAALVLAAALGAKTVDAWGADFGDGETLSEFDGFTSPEANYTPARWAHERQIWDRVIHALGIQVTRHGITRQH